MPERYKNLPPYRNIKHANRRTYCGRLNIIKLLPVVSAMFSLMISELVFNKSLTNICIIEKKVLAEADTQIQFPIPDAKLERNE